MQKILVWFIYSQIEGLHADLEKNWEPDPESDLSLDLEILTIWQPCSKIQKYKNAKVQKHDWAILLTSAGDWLLLLLISTMLDLGVINSLWFCVTEDNDNDGGDSEIIRGYGLTRGTCYSVLI